MKKIITLFLMVIIQISLIHLVFAEDTDGDGIDDIWEARNFGNLSEKGDGDYDKDGKSNLKEYVAQTDPLVKEKPSFLNIALVILLAAIFLIVAFIVLSRAKKPNGKTP